jgi:hypothetical protein
MSYGYFKKNFNCFDLDRVEELTYQIAKQATVECSHSQAVWVTVIINKAKATHIKGKKFRHLVVTVGK